MRDNPWLYVLFLIVLAVLIIMGLSFCITKNQLQKPDAEAAASRLRYIFTLNMR